MSAFSDEMAQVALDLIKEFGEDGEFNRTTQGVYDPSSGESFSETQTSFTGSIVPNNYKESEIDGTVIQRGDVRVYAHRMGANVPAIGDILTFSNIEYRVINVKKTKANGADCLYTLQVRL